MRKTAGDPIDMTKMYLYIWYFSQTDKLAPLAIVLLVADVSPTYSSGLPQGKKPTWIGGWNVGY